MTNEIDTEADSIFVPRSIEWSSASVLDKLSPESFGLSPEKSAELEPLFWNDLCSEYDAENFCRYLETSGLKLSNEFQAFEKVWRRDEANHYRGFRKIYSSLYAIPESELEERLAGKPYDFEPIGPLIEDEFKMTMVLAYDEMATTKAYAMDYDLYGSFPDPALLRWIRLVTRDESFHFNNCIEVIKRKHRDRIPEASGFASQLVQWDLGGNKYAGTFVLDHEGYYFTPEFLNDCADTIVKKLNAAQP